MKKSMKDNKLQFLKKSFKNIVNSKKLSRKNIFITKKIALMTIFF